MIRIHEIKTEADKSPTALCARVERALGLPEGSIRSADIVRESVDAREKPRIYKVYSLDLHTDIPDEKLLAAAAKHRFKAAVVSDKSFSLPPAESLPQQRPVICGFGPCGMFAALTLAMYGAKPVVLERGAAMEKRVKAVEEFWNGGAFDPVSNVQFGEGGAGTFSDGKLTTGTKADANRFVLEQLAEAGADPSILYRQHPHVGTDVLRSVVVNIRRKIQALGGSILFESKLQELDIQDGKVRGLWYSDSMGIRQYMQTDHVILALGHSARDTVRGLFDQGIYMEQKQFSMGVRIEHPQEIIDISQYGCPASELGLSPSDYKLSCRGKDGRGVYTFCMCPGGYVVAAASFKGGVVTNGMSNSDRSAENANSALLVDVRPEDFPDNHPLSGMMLQEKYEQAAFRLAGCSYMAPAERLADFMSGTSAAELAELNKDPEAEARRARQLARQGAARFPQASESQDYLHSAAAQPSYRPGVVWTDIRACLPDFVSDSLRIAIPVLDKKLKGFAAPGAVLTGPETRSSAPFRIRRTEALNAMDKDGRPIEGLYPGGEGAGYAGGIVSAAADGIRLAIAITRRNS